MAANYTEIYDSNYERIISEHKYVLIVFYHSNCIKIEPVIEQIATKYSDKVKILKADIRTCSKLVKEYNILSLPVMIMLKNGEFVERLVGYFEEPLLSQSISDNINLAHA